MVSLTQIIVFISPSDAPMSHFLPLHLPEKKMQLIIRLEQFVVPTASRVIIHVKNDKTQKQCILS